MVLVAANLTCILGIFLFNWTAIDIIWLYWIETFIVGIFNIFKILLALESGLRGLAANLFFAVFFAIHYNVFVLVQGVFIFTFSQEFPSTPPTAQSETEGSTVLDSLIGFMDMIISQDSVYWGIAAIFISHLFSFIYHYLIRGEFKHSNAFDLMLSPYKRIMIQQFVALGGGFFILVSQGSIFLLFLLVILKIVVDLAAHIREHLQILKK